MALFFLQISKKTSGILFKTFFVWTVQESLNFSKLKTRLLMQSMSQKPPQLQSKWKVICIMLYTCCRRVHSNSYFLCLTVKADTKAAARKKTHTLRDFLSGSNFVNFQHLDTPFQLLILRRIKTVYTHKKYIQEDVEFFKPFSVCLFYCHFYPFHFLFLNLRCLFWS